MAHILATNLTKIVGKKVLFQDISFSIEAGAKVALVARNGTGKTTLLKIIAGIEELDSGELIIQKGLKVAYLAQNPDLDLQKTKFDEVLSSSSPIVQAVKRYEECLSNPEDKDSLQKAYDEMEKQGAWEYELKIQEVFKQLGLTDLEGKIENYSGGQKKRLALAKIVLADADVLILDEPTNHIDIDTINWLEGYLQAKNCTLLLVTHDRYFLNKVCNEVLELDDGEIFKHKGNYDYYREKRNLRLANRNSQIDKTRKHLKKELEWIKRQPQGRQSKSGARVTAFYETKANIGKKHVEESIMMTSEAQRLGGKVLRLHNVSKSFGNTKILDLFSFDFQQNEKVGIVGKNGAGKSTLLNLIMGSLEPDSGKIVVGDTVKFGYYSQYQNELDDTQTVIESIEDVALYVKLADGSKVMAASLLEKFLFPRAVHQTPISKLSGGEKKRIALLRILMTSPNFLILDEPTNDFDMMTLEVLETFIKNFDGCLLIVSHDRYFMNSLVDHIFIFHGDGKIQNFPGNYEQYMESIGGGSGIGKVGDNLVGGKSEAARSSGKTSVASSSLKKDKDSHKKAHKLYKEIQKLEIKRKEICEKMSEIDIHYNDAMALAENLQDIDQQIEKMSEEWLVLSV